MQLNMRFPALQICLLLLSPLEVEAATCRDPAGFEAWLAGFKREAAANGISRLGVKCASPTMPQSARRACLPPKL